MGAAEQKGRRSHPQGQRYKNPPDSPLEFLAADLSDIHTLTRTRTHFISTHLYLQRFDQFIDLNLHRRFSQTTPFPPRTYIVSHFLFIAHFKRHPPNKLIQISFFFF